jgi:hypothetical protein
MGRASDKQNPTKGVQVHHLVWAASSLRRSLARQGLDSWHVADCGNCDALAPGKSLILAETDQAKGLPHAPLKLPQGHGSSSLETTNCPFSRPHLQGRSLPVP